MNEATWAAVGLAAITMLSNSISGVLAYLRGRDTLNKDVRVALLEQQSRTHEEERKSCEQNLVEIKVELARCHDQHATADAERRELRSEVDKIKTALAQAPKS